MGTTRGGRNPPQNVSGEVLPQQHSQAPSPTCPCGLQTSLFSVAAFGHFCVPGSRDGVGSIGHAGSHGLGSHLPEDHSPAPSHPVQFRLDPFSGKAHEGSIGVFNKEAHVVSRTAFVVFVTGLYLFRSSSVKTLHSLTPSHRGWQQDSHSSIYYFIPLRMVINCQFLLLLCCVKMSLSIQRITVYFVKSLGQFSV